MSQPERPTALFCSTNYFALDALLALKEMGLRCPEDVALIGFDDHPWAAVSDPPLTVVRQPARELGRAAAGALLDLIAGKGEPDARILLDCELIVRESC
jgi:DNA-binding LacI/PurR family transcriptional regulator